MPYQLGVDLGTTYTAAAIRRGDRLEIADLGTRAATIPSVVYLREDEQVLIGEAATRRGSTDPARLAREFKRRMGDTTPILLGGVPYSVDGLMARMLSAVVAQVTERQGEPPASVAVTHPANWGPYKLDLLVQAVRRADLDDVVFIAEPQAAAVHYATQERLDPGAVVAVYDLGGGTFDVAVLRKTVNGFELIGQPEGIERLGGVDFDEAVFRHTVQAIGGSLGELDPDDPVAQAAVSRLRDECVAAKEALSGDTEVSIPVLLPNVQTEVRLTRAEFEAMVRPALADTLVVLNRCLRSAGVTSDQLHSVLLVGGSSRIPLVAQLVTAELGRPVALDVHPKHSVAMGAALLAAGGLPVGGTGSPSPVTTTAPTESAAVPVIPVGPAAATPVAGPPVEASPSAPLVALAAPTTSPPDAPTEPVATAAPPPAPPPTAAAPSRNTSPTSSPPPAPSPPTERSPAPPVVAPSAPPAMVPPPGAHGGPPPAPGGAPGRPPAPRRLKPFVLGAAVAVVVALGAGAWLAFGRGGDDEGASTTEPTEQAEPDPTTAGTTGGTTAETSSVTEPSVAGGSTTTAAETTTTLATACEGIELPCIDIVDLVIPEGNFTVEITWDAYSFEPSTLGLHPHFFWNNASPAQASADAAAGTQVGWEITDSPTYTGTDVLLLENKPPEATGVCVVVGDATSVPAHSVINPEVFECVDLPVI